MPHALRVNFENFGPTTKNKIFRLVKLLADLSTRLKGTARIASCLKPSTHIDENRELTIGVSEANRRLKHFVGSGGRASLYREEKRRSPAKGQLEEPLPAIIGQPIGTRSWTTEGAGKMAKHP